MPEPPGCNSSLLTLAPQRTLTPQYTRGTQGRYVRRATCLTGHVR